MKLNGGNGGKTTFMYVWVATAHRLFVLDWELWAEEWESEREAVLGEEGCSLLLFWMRVKLLYGEKRLGGAGRASSTVAGWKMIEWMAVDGGLTQPAGCGGMTASLWDLQLMMERGVFVPCNVFGCVLWNGLERCPLMEGLESKHLEKAFIWAQIQQS